MAWELSFSSLLPCFRPFFSCETQDGFQIHKCHFTRSLFDTANAASQFSTPPRVTNPHPFVFSFDFVISAQIFWRRKRRQGGPRWRHFQQSCHLIRTARYIFNSVCAEEAESGTGLIPTWSPKARFGTCESWCSREPINVCKYILFFLISRRFLVVVPARSEI